jgi:hypothetical protein
MSSYVRCAHAWLDDEATAASEIDVGWEYPLL